VVTADLAAPDPSVLESAVHGADAVLSGLGPRSAADAGITAPGTEAVIRAMQATGVRRVVVVSAAPVGTVPSPGRPKPPRHDPGDGFFMRHLFSRVVWAAFRRHYADLALMEDLLRDSGLDWTVVRPPRLTDKPLSGSYRTAYGQNVRGGWQVSRADVAHLMLRVLERSSGAGARRRSPPRSTRCSPAPRPWAPRSSEVPPGSGHGPPPQQHHQLQAMSRLPVEPYTGWPPPRRPTLRSTRNPRADP
jgi:nucleoside-diphosphate-sugar epimerase